MRGGVEIRLATVVGARDNLAVAYDDGPDGHFSLLGRQRRLRKRHAHVGLVDGCGVGGRDVGGSNIGFALSGHRFVLLHGHRLLSAFK